MDDITFYKAWLRLDKKEFRILAMLADQGEFSGNLSDLCRYFSLSPQTRNRTQLSNFLQILLEIQDFSTIIQVNKDVVRHRTRSGLPVGETDGSRRGPSRQGFRGPAEALLRLIQTG